jgi:hypothetical protein
LWQGALNKKGYGLIGIATSRCDSCHRVSWRLNKGPIPRGKQVLHSCDVRNCWNPDHLWLGTNADNNRDMMTKGRQRLYGNAKLTVEQVLAIRADPRPQSVIAAEHGIRGHSYVSRIKRKLHWGNL